MKKLTNPNLPLPCPIWQSWQHLECPVAKATKLAQPSFTIPASNGVIQKDDTTNIISPDHTVTSPEKQNVFIQPNENIYVITQPVDSSYVITQQGDTIKHLWQYHSTQ
jgi:hypothetical protein